MRQDTFDLRIRYFQTTTRMFNAHVESHNTYGGTSDEEHPSEDDSDAEDRDVDYMDEDDDGSSRFPYPTNPSISILSTHYIVSLPPSRPGQCR